MKKSITLMLPLLVTGCAALEPQKIHTEGNAFYSSKAPSIRIEVSQEYQYFGSFKKSYEAKKDSSPTVKAEVDRELYNYGVVDAENSLIKLFQINIQHIHGRRWFSPNLINVTTSLKHGVVSFGNENFQYAIESRSNVGNHTSQFFLDRGVVLPACILSFGAGRRYGNKNNTKLYLTYMEDVSDYKEFGIESCSDWADRSLLNDKQKTFLKDFEGTIQDVITVSGLEKN